MTPHQRLVEHLASGGVDAEDRAHGARCAACAVLLSDGPEEVLAPSVQSAWLAVAHRELAHPVRPWWRQPAAFGAANLVLATAAAAFLVPSNWGATTTAHWLFLAAVAALAALAIGGVFLALAPARRSVRAALLLAVLAPLAVLLAGDGQAPARPFLAGVGCLWTVLALAVLPLAFGSWLLTRSAYHPARALAVGLASAGVGLLVLQLTCEDGSSPHLLVFHLLPWVALGGVAVLVRRALPTWSYAP
ncbi:MAG: hypothetical protein ACLPJH_06780 [Myxococcaceae bacterium]